VHAFYPMSKYVSSGDPFFSRALQAYIEQFNFLGNPLDVALRKLLMDVGLPRETQQIDRVMEAFAKRYQQCNTDLFVSDGMLNPRNRVNLK
jgi:Sec7-like guanine-nucleotide exchange factor